MYRLLVIYGIIPWLKHISWSHFSWLSGHIRIFSLVHAHEFIIWWLDESFFNFTFHWCSCSLAIWFSKCVFSFDAWDVARVSWDVESIISFVLLLKIVVCKLWFVTGVAWDFLTVFHIWIFYSKLKYIIVDLNSKLLKSYKLVIF